MIRGDADLLLCLAQRRECDVGVVRLHAAARKGDLPGVVPELGRSFGQEHRQARLSLEQGD